MKKSKIIVPIVFFLIFALSSGADNSWIEIIIGSTIFSIAATLLVTLVYKFFIFLFNPTRLINKQQISLVVDEILEEKQNE